MKPLLFIHEGQQICWTSGLRCHHPETLLSSQTVASKGALWMISRLPVAAANQGSALLYPATLDLHLRHFA